MLVMVLAEALARETITGRDERTGSEMPAEREERPGGVPSQLRDRLGPEELASASADPALGESN